MTKSIQLGHPMKDIIGEINEMFDEAVKEADTRTLGEILQAKRESLKLKLVDIARITGLSESLVGKIESDKIGDIKISTMKKLCMAYDLPPSLFIIHVGVDDSFASMSEKLDEIKNARSVLLKKGRKYE